MTKLLLFIFIFVILIRIINALFNGIYRVTGNPKSKTKNKFYTRNRNTEGEIKVDQMPNKKKGKFDNDFKGGEYIDYEEVK